MEKRSLYIKCLVDGKEAFFPSGQERAVIGTFSYEAQRMGAAPTITATLMYPRCLDNEWTRKEYVEFNGERYFISQVPSSSKDNTDGRYKHEITFVSSRIVLENVYFLDVVTSRTEEQYKDRYRSNSTIFSFMGDVAEFVSRINDSLVYSGLFDTSTGEGYKVVIDEGITSDAKEVSIDSMFIAEALQEIFNVYELSYYWVGMTCHVGYTENAIPTYLEYGGDNALLSMSKTNSNSRFIDSITGQGSSDNIQYYYPNDNAAGTAEYEVENAAMDAVQSIDLETVMSYNPSYGSSMTLCKEGENEVKKDIRDIIPFYGDNLTAESENRYVSIHGSAQDRGSHTVQGSIYLKLFAQKGWSMNFRTLGLAYERSDGSSGQVNFSVFLSDWIDGSLSESTKEDVTGNSAYTFMSDEWKRIIISYRITVSNKWSYNIKLTGSLWYSRMFSGDYTFIYGSDESVNYAESGIKLNGLAALPTVTQEWRYTDDGKWETTNSGYDTAFKLTIIGRKWITPAQNLMPSIYRETGGAERFYNAENDKYDSPDGGKYVFANIYDKNNPHEGTTSFEDIKPSIKGMVNAKGQSLGEIVDIAFDSDDSDAFQKGSDSEYLHSYFYIKLHVFDGDYGFNLFEYALASDNAVIDITDGNCAACSFEIAVEKGTVSSGKSYKFYNPVVTDTNGDLKKVHSSSDSGYLGDYISTVESQWTDRQQDTTRNEVWIAVKKETDTFGVIMPNATFGYRPKAGDSFVITGIGLPKQYVLAAEKRLDAALIKYMKENNDEKFTFSAKFSRIWIELHPDIASKINENARLTIRYNDESFPLYVSSYSCNADENILYEINVELTDNLTIAQSSLKTQIDAVKNDIMSGIGSMDFLKQGLKYFIRKDTDDEAAGTVMWHKIQRLYGGAQFGDFATGFTGFGGRIDGKGNGELESLIIRRFLEVPELRFSRTTITVGTKWRTAGAGLIESVTIDTNDDGTQAATGTVRLKLQDGEIGAVETGDICIGMFHSLTTSENATETTDDSRGNFQMAGFYTCYFTITEVSGAHNETFKYQLRPVSDNWKLQMHPSAAMSFAAYGSFTDTARQTSVYETTTYTRMLRKQNTWEMTAANIALQYGDLSNLSVHGYDMTGYSLFAQNVYFTGTIQQLRPDGTPVIQQNFRGEWAAGTEYVYYDTVTHDGTLWLCVNENGTKAEPTAENSDWLHLTPLVSYSMDVSLDGQNTIDWGETVTATCTVWHGTERVDTSTGWTWSVTRDSGSQAEDTAWNQSAKATAFNGTIALSFSSEENDLGLPDTSPYGTRFTFTATEAATRMRVMGTLSA